MTHRSRFVSIVGLVLTVSLASSLAVAAPVTFNFTFSSPSTAATAVGSITFESTLLANPGSNNFSLPAPAVLDLRVVVSGAAAGNGTFTTSDFSSVTFDTNGGTLNLTQELVGQPTSNAPWGTTDGCALGGPLGGTGGDFNLFGAGPAPNGEWFFTLSANGGSGDCMVLRSMARAGGVAPVPTLSEWGLIALVAMLGCAAVVSLRRRKFAL
jgi:hypothetical protein